MMTHTIQIWERVAESWLGRVVMISQPQYGSMLRNSSSEAALRVLMENCVFSFEII